MAKIIIGKKVVDNISSDKTLKVNLNDIKGSKENLLVELDAGSKYQVSMSENPASDVIIKVTNTDGTSYNIVLEGLATIYQDNL